MIAVLLAISIATQAPSPGYEAFTKKELWETGERFKAKWKDAEIRVQERDIMLQVRTATTVRAIAMSYDHEQKSDGIGAGSVIGWIVGAAAAGLVLGILIAPRISPPPAVVVTQ